MEIIPFGRDDIDNILQAEPHRAEFLPFGAVLLDRKGTILKYSKSESKIAGRNAGDVIGKNFFSDVAPCSKGKKIHHQFLEYARSGDVNCVLDYEFDYKMDPTKVRIHLKSTAGGDQCWMFVKRV